MKLSAPTLRKRMVTTTPRVPPLEPGDRLDQPTFHARYEAMPTGFRAELINGVVHVPSPLKPGHGSVHSKLMGWMCAYEADTPGTESFDNTTNILGPISEPQPDGILIVKSENGGQTWVNAKGYMEGPPELIAEVAHSSEAIDLFDKKEDYEKAGVQEYIVVALRKKRVYWFGLRRKKYKERPAGKDGIFRSEIFPGLWLDSQALLNGDSRRLLAVLRQGLATAEHKAWVKLLETRASRS